MSPRMMAIALLMTMVGALSGCSILDGINDRINGVPSGYTNCEEYFDPDGFQDYTDYAKYYYEDAESRFNRNGHFKRVEDKDIEEIQSYFDNFSSWMKMEKREKDYDFDKACITAGDYFYLEDKEGTPIGDSQYMKYEDYTVRLFDTETGTLYYIHSNI